MESLGGKKRQPCALLCLLSASYTSSLLSNACLLLPCTFAHTVASAACCQPGSTTPITAPNPALDPADRLAVMHEEVVAAVRAQLPPEVQLLDQLVGMRNRCAGASSFLFETPSVA